MTPSSATTIYGDLDVTVELDAPIGLRSWFTAGGTADNLVHPADNETLAEIVRRCRRSGTPLRILGEGANLLVSDDGVDGIVLQLDAPAFTASTFNVEGSVELMQVGAGGNLMKVVLDAAKRGLSGFNHLAGIPASIGGAIRMNAGGKYGAIGDHVHAVTCLSRSGEIRVYPREELEFTYRCTNIPDPIVLSAVFRVEPADPVQLQAQYKEIFAWKQSTQPMNEKSAGCMFRNPIDPGTGERISAGGVIDRAGLKGLRSGTAEVSTLHANFIALDRGGRADDAITLSEDVARRVLESSDIHLEREVVVWRRGDESTTI